jgi:hypothetical protein
VWEVRCQVTNDNLKTHSEFSADSTPKNSFSTDRQMEASLTRKADRSSCSCGRNIYTWGSAGIIPAFMYTALSTFESRVKMEAARSSETSVSYHNTIQCHNPEDGGSMDLWNVGTLPQNYMVSHPRRWRQHGPLKRRYPTTTLHGVTTQKTSTRIFTAVKASNLVFFSPIF